MKRLSSLTLILFILLGLFLAYSNQQTIQDWYILRNYDPSTEVAGLANSTAMTDSARELFYVNDPKIVEKAEFNNYCRNGEYSIVLGCYFSDQRKIYLLNVDDERLRGVMEVTAVHEMLHAAYDRLDAPERARVDVMLEEAFKTVQNKRIIETVEQYRKRDSTVVINELHSILGSEVRYLSDELEDYYSRYFTDRLKTVAFSERYEQVFVDRKNIIREYDTTLETLKKEIDDLSVQLKKASTEISLLETKMTRYKNEDVNLYNSLVPDFNDKVNSYNRDVDNMSSLVTEYNNSVQLRNAIVSEEAELIDAIDSRKLIPSQR